MTTTDGPLPQPGVADRIVHEHGALRQKIEGINSVLSGPRPEPTEVDRLLREFLTALHVHFTTEESEGFFTAIVTNAPQHAERAGELCIEHRQLLHDADDLCRFAEAGSPSMPWWRELTGRCHEFNKRLARHEREEHRLMNEAHHVGMGPAA